jgi:hypothetical protein
VADVEVPVRLRWEPCQHSPVVPARAQAFRDHLPDEVERTALDCVWFGHGTQMLLRSRPDKSAALGIQSASRVPDGRALDWSAPSALARAARRWTAARLRLGARQRVQTRAWSRTAVQTHPASRPITQWS